MGITSKFKKILALLLCGIGFIEAQVNLVILGEFDLLAKMAGKDIRSAIFEGLIPADIAITSFGVYGFTEDEKKYFQEVMNRIFYSDVAFKLISIPESQTIQVEEVEDKLIITKGANRNSDLKKYAESINSKHYGEIYIYAMSLNTYMKILVHDADTGDVVWAKTWSVKREDRFTAELGYIMGYSIESENVYHYIHSFFGARAIGLGEFGVSIDLGGYHNLSLLTANQDFGAERNTDIGDLGASFLLASKVSLNIIELAKRSYRGFDVYTIFKPGLRVDMLITSDSSGSGDPLFRPKFYFAGNAGLGLGFRNLNLDILFDVNPKSGLFASLSFYLKF